MQFQKPESFESKYGIKVAQKGFVQIPNLLTQNLKKFGIEPVDFTIIVFILSRRKDQYTAVSMISEATGKHPNTVRHSLRKLVKLGYLKKIFVQGDANKYDLSGLEKSIRVYTETGITPIHNSYTGIYNNRAKNKQYLGTNKDTKKKEIEQLKRQTFPDKKNKL